MPVVDITVWTSGRNRLVRLSPTLQCTTKDTALSCITKDTDCITRDTALHFQVHCTIVSRTLDCSTNRLVHFIKDTTQLRSHCLRMYTGHCTSSTTPRPLVTPSNCPSILPPTHQPTNNPTNQTTNPPPTNQPTNYWQLRKIVKLCQAAK